MAGSSLLTLLDDIATLLDDVSVMTKVAAKQTAGVLGDDLALNAHQVSGVDPDRELPVVWAVCKGSFVNKLILVPSALLISAFIPWLIVPLLLLGGVSLALYGALGHLSLLLNSTLMLMCGVFASGALNIINGAVASDLAGSNKGAVPLITGIVDGSGTLGAAFGSSFVTLLVGNWSRVFALLVGSSVVSAAAVTPLAVADWRKWMGRSF